METELPEDVEVDPVVHNNEGLGLFCSLSATVVGRLYLSATFPGLAGRCAL